MQKAQLLLAMLAGCAVLANAAEPMASVMQMQSSTPDVAQVLNIIRSMDKNLATYLADPETVCTFFAPTNEAMAESLRRLGKYSGKAMTNTTLQRATFNYHVIPGKALTNADLMKINETDTRANETLWILHRDGQPFVYSRPDYPIALQQTNIKAGKCIVHLIDMALVPPSGMMLVQQWLDDSKTLPTPAPREQWGEIHTPLQAELARNSEVVLGLRSNTTDTQTPAAATAPATSGASRRWGGAAAVVVGLLTAASLF